MLSRPPFIIQAMITCPNCKTIHQQPTSQCGECGRYLTSADGGGSVNANLMDSARRANQSARAESDLRNPALRRTGRLEGVPMGESTVNVARGQIHKLFDFKG